MVDAWARMTIRRSGSAAFHLLFDFSRSPDQRRHWELMDAPAPDEQALQRLMGDTMQYNLSTTPKFEECPTDRRTPASSGRHSDSADTVLPLRRMVRRVELAAEAPKLPKRRRGNTREEHGTQGGHPLSGATTGTPSTCQLFSRCSDVGQESLAVRK